MLKHIVLFKFKEGFTEDQVKAISDGMDALPAKVPQIVSYQHGKDAALSPGKYDYGLVAEFASEADYRAYSDHPDHKAIGAVVVPILAEAASMQFFFD